MKVILECPKCNKVIDETEELDSIEAEKLCDDVLKDPFILWCKECDVKLVPIIVKTVPITVKSDIMTVLTQEELLTGINNCLGRNDISEIEYTILNSLKYLLLTQDKTIIKD